MEQQLEAWRVLSQVVVTLGGKDLAGGLWFQSWVLKVATACHHPDRKKNFPHGKLR